MISDIDIRTFIGASKELCLLRVISCPKITSSCCKKIAKGNQKGELTQKEAFLVEVERKTSRDVEYNKKNWCKEKEVERRRNLLDLDRKIDEKKFTRF